MSESQNIEYKESWRDEYLKWICGFANAQGGRIYIGINDKQEIVGVADSKQNKYLQPIITQYFIDNKSEIWLLFLIAHSKR